MKWEYMIQTHNLLNINGISAVMVKIVTPERFRQMNVGGVLEIIKITFQQSLLCVVVAHSYLMHEFEYF